MFLGLLNNKHGGDTIPDVIEDPKLKEFIESNIDNEFGLTIEEVAENCKSHGRFSAWLNEDVSSIIDILNIVQANGVSPSFFASYERTEGYNPQWGWLNHTSVDGSYSQDADSVSQWVADQSNVTSDDPAWIDLANYNDFVPEDVKQAGNEHFANLPTGTIGRVVIAGTAAATWEVYYPNGLLEEYNGVQDYGTPITNMLTYIEDWGGSINGGGNGGGNGDDGIDIDAFIDEVLSVVNEGEANIQSDIENAFNNVDIPSFDHMFEAPLFKNSKTFYTNNMLKATHTYGNMMKINPTSELDFDFGEVLDDLEKNINGIVVSGFDSIIQNINNIDIPSNGGGNGGGGNGEKFFPVDINGSGINFWYPPYDTDLTANMDYGTRTSGDFHAGYDVGGGGTNHPIYAVAGGEVIDVREAGGWGQIVTINHSDDEYYSLYAHLVIGSQIVSVGDKVNSGDRIATMGASGGNYAIHLHYELSTSEAFGDNGDVLDPKDYLEITGNNSTNLTNPA